MSAVNCILAYMFCASVMLLLYKITMLCPLNFKIKITIWKQNGIFTSSLWPKAFMSCSHDCFFRLFNKISSSFFWLIPYKTWFQPTFVYDSKASSLNRQLMTRVVCNSCHVMYNFFVPDHLQVFCFLLTAHAHNALPAFFNEIFIRR